MKTELPGVRPAIEIWNDLRAANLWFCGSGRLISVYEIEAIQSAAFAAGERSKSAGDYEAGMRRAAEILINQGLPANPTMDRAGYAYHAILALVTTNQKGYNL